MSTPRSWMFVPGSDERKINKIDSFHPDVFIFDLEDAVANHEKENARQLVVDSLQHHPEKLKYIRINSYESPYFLDDLNTVVAPGLAGIVLPKAEAANHIKWIDRMVSEKEKENGIEAGKIKIVPLIESALGLYHSYEIANSSTRVERLAFGAIDYTLDIHAELTKDGEEILYARSHLVAVSRAAGIGAPIDTPYVDIKDSEGFLYETRYIKSLGFQGKLVIHPSQISLVNQVFTLNREDIDKALEIVEAYENALVNDLGVLQFKGKMVDLPVVEKARRIVEMAGLLKSNS
ncbi:HpcH/HpaI aldolase/citrate lyase family protein [Neobacillus vireti]|uniref:HpcH/HpaI aldolase/citrate lyase family protein n=1 Tax=Neobacillus vireti TaxID=220686 RepID=UPI00300036E4